MKKLLLSLTLLLTSAPAWAGVLLSLLMLTLSASGQTVILPKTKVLPKSVVFGVTGVSVTGDVTFLQSTAASTAIGPEVQGTCTAATSTCTFKLPRASTAGGYAAVSLQDYEPVNVTITSAYMCSGAGPCNSGNAINTATLCAASACHNSNASDDIDAAYFLNETSGATTITVNLSGNVSSFNYYFIENYPPLCNGSPCTSSYDTAQTAHSAGPCGGCSSGTLTLASTDGIIGFLDSSATVTVFSPYVVEQTGNFLTYGLTSNPNFTVGTSGYYTISQIAFKFSAGAYTPPTYKFSAVNIGPPPPNTFTPTNTTLHCAPTCTLTLPNATTSGNLGFLHAGPNSANATISAVTGFTVPTGGGTCQDTTVNSLSCAYNLSLGSGTTSLAITMSGTADVPFAWYEIHRTSGSFLVDAQNSASGGTTSLITAPTISLAGTDEVGFCEMTWTSTARVGVGATLFPQPGGQNFFYSNNYGGSQVLLHATIGTGPSELLDAAATSSRAACIYFK